MIAIGYLLWLNAKLVGVLFVGLAILSIFAGGFRRITSSLNLQYLQQKAKLTQISEEVFNNIRTVKVFNSEHEEIANYRKINERIKLLGNRHAVWSGIFQTVSYALMYSILVGITYVGATMAMNGNMTSG